MRRRLLATFDALAVPWFAFGGIATVLLAGLTGSSAWTTAVAVIWVVPFFVVFVTLMFRETFTALRAIWSDADRGGQ